MKDNSYSAIILAAGKGKRMKSFLPKALHTLCDKPLLYYIITCLEKNNISNISVVVGHGAEYVEKYLKNFNVNIVQQKEQLGTAHAVNCLCDYFKDKPRQNILIINCDTPLLKSQTICDIIEFHSLDPFAITVVTSFPENNYGYGRIIRDDNNTTYLKGIIEEKDASSQQKQIKEINTGIYCVNSSILFDLISLVSNENVQKEYYLTDIVKIGLQKKIYTRGFILADYREGAGINSREELSVAESIMQDFIKKSWMEQGVQFILPETIYIGSDVRLSRDVIIEPSCIIKGNTIIHEGCYIGGFSYIEDSNIEKKIKLEPYSKIINRNVDNLLIKS